MIKDRYIYRYKNFWRVRVTIVFTAKKLSLIVCNGEQHVDDRSVKLTVFM